MVIYGDGLPFRRQSPIRVVTGLGTEQLRPTLTTIQSHQNRYVVSVVYRLAVLFRMSVTIVREKNCPPTNLSIGDECKKAKEGHTPAGV